jgi:hypothetical protein
MADTQSLFQEVGLGLSPEEKTARQAQIDPQGLAAGANLLGGLGGAIGSLFGKNKDRSLVEGFQAGFSRESDKQIAQATGVPVDTVTRRRKIRQESAKIAVTPTGDDIADQKQQLKQLAELAEKHGDTELLLNINRKRMQLRITEKELDELELGNEAARIKNEKDSFVNERAKYTGMPILLPGDNPHDKNFIPTHGEFSRETGLWTVTRPNGEVEVLPEGTSVMAYDPRDYTSAAGKLGDTPLAIAVKRSGGSKSFDALSQGLVDMHKIAGITEGVADAYLSIADPQAVSNPWFRKAGNLANNAIRFAESTARIATLETGDTTYVWDNGKPYKNNQYHINGKVVSEARQREWANEQIEKGIEAMGGIQALFPGVKEAAAAQGRFKAMIMELAYMDARMQEPSNRGLSDKDIEAALERIGAFSSDPTVFIDRQIQLAKRSLNEISPDNLGIKFADTTTSTGDIVTKEQLVRETFNPELVNKVRTRLQANIERLTQAREAILVKLGALQPSPPPTTGLGLTRQQILDEIARKEAEEIARKEAEQGTP